MGVKRAWSLLLSVFWLFGFPVPRLWCCPCSFLALPCGGWSYRRPVIHTSIALALAECFSSGWKLTAVLLTNTF